MRTTHPRCTNIRGPRRSRFGDVEDSFAGASGGAVLKSTVAAAVEDANSLDLFSLSPLFLWPQNGIFDRTRVGDLERGDQFVFSCRASVYRDPNGRGSWTRCCTTTSLVFGGEVQRKFDGRCWEISDDDPKYLA